MSQHPVLTQKSGVAFVIVLGVGAMVLSSTHPMIAALVCLASEILLVWLFIAEMKGLKSHGLKKWAAQVPKDAWVVLGAIVVVGIMGGTSLVDAAAVLDKTSETGNASGPGSIGINKGRVEQHFHEATPPAKDRNISFMQDCSQSYLPIPIAAGQTAYILPAESRWMYLQQVAKLLSVPNDTNLPITYPDKNTVKNAGVLGGMIWKCTVSNQGDVNALNVSVKTLVTTGLYLSEPYDIEIGPIKAGGESTYYIVNDCPYQTTMRMQDEAVVELVGSSTPEKTQISWPKRNAIGRFVVLPGTTMGGSPGWLSPCP